ncbi:MAG: hypothetical protein WDO24_21775 [Pseudomonadota bacterium]
MRGFADIVQTIRDISGNRILVSMILLAGGYSFLIGNAYQAQMPEFARDFGHGDAGPLYSMLLAADATGAFLAGILLETRGLLQPRTRTAFLLAMLWCCAIGGFAAVTSYPAALLLLFVAGFLELSFSAMAQTLVQIHAPAGDPRPRARPLRHGRAGLARLRRGDDRRHGRRARHPLVARPQCRRAARGRHRPADALRPPGRRGGHRVPTDQPR